METCAMVRDCVLACEECPDASVEGNIRLTQVGVGLCHTSLFVHLFSARTV